MNLLLVFQHDFIAQNTVEITDRRFEHIKKIHKANTGDTLQVGLLNGKVGTGTITHIDQTHAVLNVQLTQEPPPPLPITLIIALPRPQMLKRILQTCATMGVKTIIFIHSRRVEKSYWQTPLLTNEKVHDELILGLEQAKDTVLPNIIFEKRFKPFVEDRLTNIAKNTTALVAHPDHNTPPCPHQIQGPTTLLIGPEGGFITEEVELFKQAGFKSVHLGTRILRVETAVTALLARLF